MGPVAEMTAFEGFPVAALDFYDDLELDNTRSFWTAHKTVYEEAVRAPMLALVAALRNPGRFRAVLLTYPFLDPRAAGESYTTAGDGFDPREAVWYWEQYARTPADLDDPDLAPLLSDRLHTLPPTLVISAEHDPLRDEAELLAARLADAGVTVTGFRVLGQLHGFWRHPDVFDAAEPVNQVLAGFVRAHHP